MRDIKFRAKRKKTGEWICGLLVEGVFGDTIIQVKENGFRNTYMVIHETVGQHIGLKGYKGDYDNRRYNEVELYEGDIVEAMSEGSKGTFVITWRQESSPGYILFPAWQSRKMWHIHASCLGRKEGDYYDDLKLIGNIHDNPELLTPLKGERINMEPNQKQPDELKSDASEQATQESAALNAAEDQANDALGEPAQDSEEGSIEG